MPTRPPASPRPRPPEGRRGPSAPAGGAAFAAAVLLSACAGDQKLGVYREPPAVAIESPADGSSFYTGQPIDFSARVVIYDSSDPASITHRWVANAQTLCEGGTFSADLYGYCSAAFEEAGEYAVEVQVTDPTGNRATASTTVQILANSPPTIDLTGPAEGSVFLSEDLIVFEALVADAEEDPANLIITASSNVDGPITFGTSPASTGIWSGGANLTAGQHLLTFTVFDSYGQSDQDSLQIEVVDNGPPRIEGVSITPLPADTEDELIATPNGWLDYTGSPERYRYAWYKEDETGAFVLDAAVTTANYPAGRTEKHDLLRVDVTPYNDWGDGPTVSSAVHEIVNAPPSQPSIGISPSAPQPGQPLYCELLTPSTDADGDAISYEYAWYLNGALTSNTTNVVPGEEVEHGDTWECVVTPVDDEDDGVDDRASVVISDTFAPDAPVINTPYPHRNEAEWSLSGTCEPGCALAFSCYDSSTSWTQSATCAGDGTFTTATAAITRGDTSACSAVCTDGAGNVSGSSNTVTTEVCDPYDTNEDAFGYGDAGTAPIDLWSTLPDTATTSISIEGNVLGTDSEDWYVVSTSDDIASNRLAGENLYKVDIVLLSGLADYEFRVYKGSPDPLDLECSGTGAGYNEYSDYAWDRGDGTHTIPADPRDCVDSSDAYNNCEDLSSDYYIQVTRIATAPSSCDSYEILITNGVW